MLQVVVKLPITELTKLLIKLLMTELEKLPKTVNLGFKYTQTCESRVILALSSETPFSARTIGKFYLFDFSFEVFRILAYP